MILEGIIYSSSTDMINHTNIMIDNNTNVINHNDDVIDHIDDEKKKKKNIFPFLDKDYSLIYERILIPFMEKELLTDRNAQIYFDSGEKRNGFYPRFKK
jgi:hypothetical protein